MKRINLKRIAAAVIAVSSVFVGVYGSTVPSAAEPDEYHDDWLHVNENAEIVDMYGNPVWLTGCNWFELKEKSGKPLNWHLVSA